MRQQPLTKTLAEAEGRVAQELVYGHAPSIVDAVLQTATLREAAVNSFLDTICQECNTLCQRKDGATSLFRSIPATAIADLQWQAFIDELQSKAPTLLRLFTMVASFHDHRNKVKTGASHYPGICSAVAVLLKERSREMCGLQSIISALMYACHCEKQVHNISTHTHKQTKRTQQSELAATTVCAHTGLLPAQPGQHAHELLRHPQARR